MSGAKRRTKYRKQVEMDVLDSFPEPGLDEEIVEMVCSRGGNLLEVRTPEGQLELCRLPAKFRKVIWVKRGELMKRTMWTTSTFTR
jgi:probable RNA-binding protein EIF1AD